MKRDLAKPPVFTARDEAAMRAFYESCGISAQTTNAAILARRNKPVDESQPFFFKGKPEQMAASGAAHKPLHRKR
jgi:hypothetical protein